MRMNFPLFSFFQQFNQVFLYKKYFFAFKDFEQKTFFWMKWKKKKNKKKTNFFLKVEDKKK